jgi:hypothetical protein
VTEPVWPDPDPGWRVRIGGGLLVHAPVSDELREQNAREDEREQERADKARKLRDELTAEAAAERGWEMARQGYTPRSPGELLAVIAADDARREAIRQRRAAQGLHVVDEDAFGVRQTQQQQPERPWRPTPWELKANQAAREAAKQTTPATQAELGKVEQAVTHVKALLHAATGHKAV